MFKFENVDDLKKLEKEAAFPDRLHEKTIYKSLNRVAKNFPSRPAISFQITSKPGSKSETYTWSELHEIVVKAANAFRKVGIKKDSKGRIEVNEKLQTSVSNIYAIGDVIKGPM